MSIFEWNDSLATGIPKVDDQHKVLISMTSSLHQAMKSGKGKDILMDILNGLLLYTETHFRDEEALLRLNSYPAYSSHKKIHDDFVAQVKSMVREADEGKSLVTIELSKFLNDWIRDHISKMDQQYVPLIKSK